MFKGSTYEIIKDAYPKHRWLPWKFHQTPKQWWASRKNQLQYIEWLRETLGYTDLEDLYLLTASDIIKHDGMFREILASIDVIYILRTHSTKQVACYYDKIVHYPN